MKVVKSYGGGVNSTAVLVGLVKQASAKQGIWKRIPRRVKKIIKRVRPDAILFADPGAERPYTYEYIEMFSKWLVSRGFPPITTVRYRTKDGEILTLEQDVLKNKTLPAIAFGYKSCSDKFKIRPQSHWIRFMYPGEHIIHLIGFDANEKPRIRENPLPNHTNKYLLVEWGWTRKRCEKEIKSVGLPLPGKSSCGYCPNMKLWEILSLTKPERNRAIRMEANAENVSELKGLGRNKSWTEIFEADEKQIKIEWEEEDWNQPPCECIT